MGWGRLETEKGEVDLSISGNITPLMVLNNTCKLYCFPVSPIFICAHAKLFFYPAVQCKMKLVMLSEVTNLMNKGLPADQCVRIYRKRKPFIWFNDVYSLVALGLWHHPLGRIRLPFHFVLLLLCSVIKYLKILVSCLLLQL